MSWKKWDVRKYTKFIPGLHEVWHPCKHCCLVLHRKFLSLFGYRQNGPGEFCCTSFPKVRSVELGLGAMLCVPLDARHAVQRVARTLARGLAVVHTRLRGLLQEWDSHQFRLVMPLVCQMAEDVLNNSVGAAHFTSQPDHIPHFVQVRAIGKSNLQKKIKDAYQAWEFLSVHERCM